VETSQLDEHAAAADGDDDGDDDVLYTLYTALCRFGHHVPI